MRVEQDTGGRTGLRRDMARGELVCRRGGKLAGGGGLAGHFAACAVAREIDAFVPVHQRSHQTSDCLLAKLRDNLCLSVKVRRTQACFHIECQHSRTHTVNMLA
jgi:hypothetical protein